MCSAQLFDEEVDMAESIDFQIPMKTACIREISTFCKDVPHGHARVIRYACSRTKPMYTILHIVLFVTVCIGPHLHPEVHLLPWCCWHPCPGCPGALYGGEKHSQFDIQNLNLQAES